MSAEQQQPQPPAMNPPIDLNTIIRTIIIRNKEIIGELVRLAVSCSNMTILPLSATGLISQAEVTPRGFPESVTVVNGPQRIEAIFGAINLPHLNVWRTVVVLVTLSRIAGGSCRAIRLVSHGDVEVKYIMRRVLQEQVPVPLVLPAAAREHRILTVTTNRDICGWLASLSQTTGQIIYLQNATGKISDGTVYSYTRQEILTNLGRADILQLVGHVFPNGTVQIDLTLSGVFGGTAIAYRLITDGDVVLEVTLVRNQ